MDIIHGIKSIVIRGIISAYKVIFLDWDMLLCKCTWISLIERQLSPPFPHKKLVLWQRDVGRRGGEGQGTCGKCLPAIWPGISAGWSHGIVSALPQSYIPSFLWICVGKTQLQSRFCFQSGHCYIICSSCRVLLDDVCLSVYLTTELAEGGKEQQGRAES